VLSRSAFEKGSRFLFSDPSLILKRFQGPARFFFLNREAAPAFCGERSGSLPGDSFGEADLDETMLRLDLLGSVLGIVDETESGGCSTSVVGLHAENNGGGRVSLGVRLGLGQVLADELAEQGLVWGWEVRMFDVEDHLTTVKKAVLHQLARGDCYCA